MNVIPCIIRHIPTMIATYNGCANENAAKKIAIIPNIIINIEVSFDIVSDPENKPSIPINIRINAIK